MRIAEPQITASNLLPLDGELFYLPDFIEPSRALSLLETLDTRIGWQQEEIKLYGRAVKVPRLVCWYGDAGANYTYSGVLHEPRPWLPILLEIKQAVEQLSGHEFNSVLANLYRNENDSMGWHADKEKELGPDPFIASVSLGETRRFRLAHKKSKHTLDIELQSGSLLLMGGSMQHHWRHSLPKCRRVKKKRINLTYRKIICGT